MEVGEEFGPWLSRQLKLAGKTQAELADELTAEVKLPRVDELPAMTPVVLLDVRSGSRPRLDWAELVAVEGCEVEDGVLRFTPRARRAVFRGSTDASGHPVRTELTRLVLELRAGTGE
ncbi:hypothetical protein SAURM35S_09069 [Streptomyces aurantiogriseus]